MGRRGYPDDHGHTLLSSSDDINITFAVIPHHPYPTRKTYRIHPKMPRKAHLTNHMLRMVTTDMWLKNNMSGVWTIRID